VAQLDKVIRNAAESLYGDERLRAHLTDSEAQVVLGWAESWVTERLNSQVAAASTEVAAKKIADSELARVRQVAVALNSLAQKPGTIRLADAVAAFEAPLTGGKAFTREEVLSLLTMITSAAWKMRAIKK
jgi:hypothetical protein